MKFHSLFSTITLLFLSLSNLSSQEIFDGEKAQALYPVADLVRTSVYSDLPSYIRFKSGSEIDLDQTVLWMKKNFKIDETLTFELKNSNKDGLGFEHFRFQQNFNGKPIQSAMWIVHSKDGKVYSMNGLIYSAIPQAGNYSLSENQALNEALEFVGAETYKWQVESEELHVKVESGDPAATYYPVGEKVYVSKKSTYLPESFRAAYRFNIYAHSTLYRSFVYVDASTGEILGEEEILHDANTPGTAITAYSGPQTIITDSFGGTFRLRETTRGNGVNTYDMNQGTSYGASVDFTDADNNWNNINAQLDQYATDAHWGAEMTYDYFFFEHNRNSIDDNGFTLNSYVHYDNNYANAFWDGQRMTYGDGDGPWDPLTSIDIAGHEITHGLTTFTADLIYNAESGALNESFSDIFGTAIENYARPTNWNWLVGEDIGSALRSMSNPNSFGDPDTYFGTNWASLTGGDNGGVHSNSGVQNYWYYLMVQGGSGTNDIGNAFSVAGLGFESASEIAFRNLTVYLTPNSNFSDARFFAIQSAIDLFGACTPEVETTTNAWYAVGVGNVYIATVIANFSAPVVTSCSAPFTVNFTNTSNNGSTFVWNFGDGGTSTDNNPSYTYNSPGTYNVSLTADGGSCGTDAITIVDFITIDNLLPCEVILPTSGTANTQTVCSGTLFDSGGPTSNYGAYEDAQITIAPTGASSVSLSFISFDIEEGTSGTNCNYDFLRVYNGPSTASPLIGTYCNNNLPPATINSTGNAITLVFHSDEGLEESGFEIAWNCVYPTSPPVTDFSANITATCDGQISFTDLSTNIPSSWSWDFGDGTNSTDQNPTHTYLTNGTYTVQLIATNSFGSDAEIKTSYITVNKPAGPAVNGDAICADNSADLTATGLGNLTWYDSPLSTTILGTGTNFTTPILSNTTTYYVEEEIQGDINFVGPPTNTIGAGGNFNGDQHQIFNCVAPVILKSVLVYANGSGNRTIQLRDNVGNVIQSTTVNIPAGTSTVQLDFDLPVGTGLQLGTLAGSSPSLYRNSAGASYPYTLPGQVTITGSSAGGAYYYFFYNWEIQEYSCLSERSPVVATVTPQEDATIAPITPMCSNDSPIVLSALNPGGTWSGTGVSGNTFDPTIAGIGNHTITYTISGVCGDTDTESIAVSDGFNATINLLSSMCSDDAPINLTAADAGGTWSGTGITNASLGTFDPNQSGPGTFTITYTIGGACGDVDTEDILVNDQADATIQAAPLFCSNDAALNLSATNSGGTWSGIGITDVSTGTFDPAVSGIGTFIISYSIDGVCPDSDTEEVTVNTQSDATIAPAGPFCRHEGIATLSAAENGGTWSADCVGCIDAITGEFNPTAAGEGTWTVIYQTGTLCPDSDTMAILVNDCLGLTQDELNAIILYPNPANDLVIIETGVLTEGEIVITDVLGREIMRLTLNSTKTVIPLQAIQARGTYFVHILNQEGLELIVKKLIKK